VRGILDFRVLGPLEVRRDGAPLRLGGERQRSLLAALLLHANEVVPSERLIEELFGGGDAANALQVAVSRLRRLLEDGVLVTRDGGYLLAVAPEQLDAAGFERLLAEGRAALEQGDPALARDRLGEALALWRGPPLADLALLDFAQTEIRRLEELRLVALQERIEADLALGRDGEFVPELEALVRAHPLQERLRGQLMLALYRAGRQAEALAVYRETRELLREELGLEPSRALQDMERAMLRQDASLEHQPRPRPAPEGTVVCPFKGLAAFTAGDAEYFYGRERIVSDLVARLVGSSFVGIVGPSGSGKSSLLQAGLLPALAGGVLPGSDRWPALLLRPGEHPHLEPPEGERAVVAVDQLEELFTVCAEEAERARFLTCLAELAGRGALVVVTLRADFYGRFAAHPRFAELLSRNHVLVGPMERDELRRAIELPAARAGLQVERELVDALVDDVASGAGALPLLSAALLELWRQRDGPQLRYEPYRRSGGVRGAVARLAETAFAELDAQDQDHARGLLLRLAADADEAVVRRRLPLAEIGAGLGHVVDVLTEARLLTVREGTLEISHEALLTEWPRLRAWLDEGREGRRLHRHLATSAREWDARRRDPGELYRGPRLAAALEWAAKHEREPNELERAFLDAGRAESERRVRRLRALLAGVAVLLALAVAAGVVALLQRRSAQHEAIVALARQLGAEAVSEPRIDRAMLLAREAVNLDDSPQTEGTLLATLLRDPAAPIKTLTLPLGVRPLRISLNPNGRTLVVSDNVGELRFFDATTGRESRPPFTDAMGYVPPAYSRDGALTLTVAAGEPPPGLQLLDSRTLRRVRLLRFDARWRRSLTGAVIPFGLSPDGKTAFFAYDVTKVQDGPELDAYVDVWDVRTGKLSTRPLGSKNVIGARLLGDGSRLVTVTSTEIATWDTRTLGKLRSVHPQVRLGGYADVSPDGGTVAADIHNGGVGFVDAEGHVTAARSATDHGAAFAFRFSPDGLLVATTHEDGTVNLWDPASGRLVETFLGHSGRAIGVDFTPDGDGLYGASLDGTIFEWGLGGDRGFGRPFTYGPAIPKSPSIPLTPPLALAPDGSGFAVEAGRSQVAIYRLPTLRRRALFSVGGSPITALGWSPDGRALAVATLDGPVQLWTTTGQPRRGRRLLGLRAAQAVAFGSDGQLGATSATGQLAVWSADSGIPAAKLTLGSPARSIAFSPDGARIAAGLDDGRVAVLAAHAFRIERAIRPTGGPTVSLAFAPDGSLVTGSTGGVVQRWNAATGAQVGHAALVAAGPVASISFARNANRFATIGLADSRAKLWTATPLQQLGASFPRSAGEAGHAAITPDGADLVVVSSDGSGSVWPISVRGWTRRACAVAGRNFTREEWNRFVSGRNYTATCPGLPTGG
jgi:DNA-binding SARP family transcriptional activator/WD40 repeat protein/energy-coupling factor transporter ATP-binding protein EcfA2